MTRRQRPPRPTLDEVRAWPATVSVADAALAVGVSRAYAYRLLQRQQFPVRTRLVGARRVVVTAALVVFLENPSATVNPSHAGTAGSTPAGSEGALRARRPAGQG